MTVSNGGQMDTKKRLAIGCRMTAVNSDGYHMIVVK